MGRIDKNARVIEWAAGRHSTSRVPGPSSHRPDFQPPPHRPAPTTLRVLGGNGAAPWEGMNMRRDGGGTTNRNRQGKTTRICKCHAVAGYLFASCPRDMQKPYTSKAYVTSKQQNYATPSTQGSREGGGGERRSTIA